MYRGRLLEVWWALLAAVSTTVTLSTQKSRVLSPADYKTLYFRQPVDHFGYTTADTYLQRYLLTDKFWNHKGGPIFFYTGNEGDIVLFCENTGLMWDWAPEFGAMLVFAEHRYYGESMPYGNDSYKGLNHLGYLSSEQALADFASLIDYLKHTIPGAQTSPVVAFGGSYGGMLSAWFRMKYPHSVAGALAASAPVWMFEDLVPCGRYSQIVTHDFDVSGPNCVKNIRRSWKVITEMAQTDAGRATLTSTLALCQPIGSASDAVKLKGWLVETYGNLAMVDYPYPASFLEPLPAWPIKVVCSHLGNETLTDVELLEQLRAALGVYYNYTGSATCFDTNQTAVGTLSDVGWSFQACTEMVMPMCSNGVDDMFEPTPWNLTQYMEDCYNQWNVTPRPQWVVQQYGGKNISSASNIIFSNGDLDPWSAGGVLPPSVSSSVVSLLIKDGAHHLDLRAAHPGDTPSVVKARQKEKAIVTGWLKASPPKQEDCNFRQIIIVPPQNADYGGTTDEALRVRHRLPAPSDKLVVLGIMVAMFIGLLLLVGFTGQRRRNRLLYDSDRSLLAL